MEKEWMAYSFNYPNFKTEGFVNFPSFMFWSIVKVVINLKQMCTIKYKDGHLPKLVFIWVKHLEERLPCKGKQGENVIRFLTKSMNEYGYLGSWYTKSTHDKKFLNWNKMFQKIKVITGKTLFFVIISFCSTRSIFLNISLWLEILYGNLTFLIISSYQLENGTPIFWKSFSSFKKFISKFK